jgi:hypothetical protein
MTSGRYDFKNAINVRSLLVWVIMESFTEKYGFTGYDVTRYSKKISGKLLLLICKCSIKAFNIQLNS